MRRFCNALAVALGQRRDAPVLHGGDPGFFHHFGNLALQFFAPQALGLAHKAQVFARGFVQVQRRVLRQVADQPLGFVRLLIDVVPVDAHAPGRGRKAAGDDVHRCRFARAVGAQETVNMAVLDRERNIVHRQEAAVVFGQVLYFDHRAPPALALYVLWSMVCASFPVLVRGAPAVPGTPCRWYSIGAEHQLLVNFGRRGRNFRRFFTIRLPFIPNWAVE